MKLQRIELRYRDAPGTSKVLAAAHRDGTPQVSATDNGLTIAATLEPSSGGIVARAQVINRSSAPVRLGAMWFDLSTGFAANAAAKFFKHGYQSWSASRAFAVGATREHPRDAMLSLIRLNHQSEVTRPPEAPEAATSELFTIVESSGDGERAMAGFIGGASALTTITVLSPDLIHARAILDDVELAPGATRDIEPLYFTRLRESAAELAARWAAMIGGAMKARTDAPYQRGWCSWYHYFHAITEDAMRANLRALAAMRSEFPVDVVQLDDGFQSALGDWDTTNSKFPGGLAKLADEIRRAGFEPGLWTAPFLAARDSRIMREHPDWLIRHKSGEMLKAAYNPSWTTDQDAFAYALDPSNPAFRDHLVRLFRKIVAEFGYRYLKLDFLYAAAAEGIRHNPNLTRAETLRAGLEAIREGAGTDAFILGCGCPLGPAIGVVDGMRIGPDVAPFWGGGEIGDPSTVHALDAIVARSFMHRRLWLNDPDCLMLRARETKLNAEERGALAATIAGSGGMLLISDDMALLGADESAIYRAAAALGAEMDSGSANDPILPADLLTTSAVRTMVKRTREGAVAIVLNRGDEPARFAISDLNLGDVRAMAQAVGSREADVIGGSIEIPPHAARIVRLKRV